MKKIILMIIAMFSFIIVNAEETVSVRLEWVPNVYYNYEKNGLNYWGQFAYIYADDKVAYCLDISKNVNSSIYTKSNETQNNRLVILAGYFGYGYDGNVNLKDYMATQKLIWSYLGTDVYFTTKSNGLGEKIDIWDNELRIRYKINNHALVPLYDSDFKFIIGSTNSLLQQNKANNGYNIINSTGNIINFSNDGILFNANEVGKNDFYLETKYIKNFENEIYAADDSQKIMVIGEIGNIKAKYSYEVIGGTLNIRLKYIKNINNSNVSDNLFGIYDENNELVGLYSPDINGNISVNNLKLGKYKIKELNICEGYKTSRYVNDFEITENYLNQTREIYLYPKTIDVTINKTYSNTLINDLNYDEGILYKIYDSNGNYINELITNEKGNAIIALEYGNYKIVQSNINNIDIYHEDIVIDTSMFDDNLIFNIHDDIKKVKIKVLAFDKKTNEPISNLNFKINNEEKNTNDNGIYITDLLNFETYEFSNITKEGYIEHENFEYSLDENIEYYIFENEAYVDLIMYLDKIKKTEISIEVDENTNEENNNIVNEEDNEDVNIIEDDDNKFESITTNNDDLEQNINKENLNIDTGKQSVEFVNNNTEKLPFLGENVDKNEKSKIYNYINYIFNCDWLFFIWI